MIKIILCTFIMLNVGVLYGADEYTVKLKDDTQSSGIQEIQVSKKALDIFYAIATHPSSSNVLDYSEKNYTVSAFELAVDIAYTISDQYDAQSASKASGRIYFSTKSKIVQELQNKSVEDVLGCVNIFFHLNGPESVQKLLNTESIRLLKKFMSKEEGQTINLGEIDISSHFEALKKEVVNIFATSDEIIDFSQNNVHLDLPGTKDKEINREIIVPYGTLYAYTTGIKQPMHLFNIVDQKKVDYKIPTQRVPNIQVVPIESLYVARFANKIAGLTSAAPGTVLLFSENGSVVAGFGAVSTVAALSADGKFFLSMLVAEDRCFLQVYDLIKDKIAYATRVAYISKSRKLRGCCFNPDDSNTFLYYTDEQVCVSDEDHLHDPILLRDFDGEIIKAAFSDDGSYIYVLTWHQNKLVCYRYHYLEPAGKISIQHPSNNIEVLDVVNSADNEQLFVECSYNRGNNLPSIFMSYDLIKFDFGGEGRQPFVQNLFIGPERETEGFQQKLDVRMLGNLLVYKAKNKIHFYDCFFNTQPLPPLGVDKCRSILGFSSDGSLWLRIDPGAADVRGMKKSEEYLISYNVRNKELLDGVVRKIDAKLDLNDCLELLTEHRKNRTLWYKSAYEKINSDDSHGLEESSAYAKAYEKAAILQSTQSKQAKQAQEILEAEESLKEAREERARQLDTAKQVKALQAAKEKRDRREQQLEQSGVLTPLASTVPAPVAPPQSNIFQRAANWIIANIVTPIFRWLGFMR